MRSQYRHYRISSRVRNNILKYFERNELIGRNVMIHHNFCCMGCAVWSISLSALYTYFSLPFLRRRASNHRECVRTTFWVEKVPSSRLEDGLVGMLFEQLYVYSGSPTNRASTVLVVVCVQQVRHVHLFSFMLLSVCSFLLNDPCPYILSGLPSLFF